MDRGDHAAEAAKGFADTLTRIVVNLKDDESQCAGAVANLVVGLYSLRRFEDVERNARIWLPLLTASNAPQVQPGCAMIAFVRACAGIERGENARVQCRRVFRSTLALDEGRVLGTVSNRMYAHLLTGLLTTKEVLRCAARLPRATSSVAASHASSVLLLHAAVFEQVQDLAKACSSSMVPLCAEATARDIVADAQARAVLAALQGGGDALARQFATRDDVVSYLANARSYLHLSTVIALCQLLRLGGDEAAARDEFRHVQRAVDAAGTRPPERLIWMVLHYRNALSLAAGTRDPWFAARADEARHYISALTKQGYRSLKPLETM